jgi:hypothetical protein
MTSKRHTVSVDILAGNFYEIYCILIGLEDGEKV